MYWQDRQKVSVERPSISPFAGKKIYYSGSIAGVSEKDPDLAESLVSYMIKNGGTVLSEHVAVPYKQDAFKSRLAKTLGLSLERFLQLNADELSRLIYENDIELVDKATHVVALVNAPSHGVGMEIQRALDKPRMGLNVTPILCLAHEERVEKLSSMIRGVSRERYPHFCLKTYRELSDAQKAICDFLTGRS